MQIAVLALLSFIAITNTIILFRASNFKKPNFDELFSHQNAESVEAAIIEELVKYCDSKGIKGAYFDTTGTTAGLSYEKDGETVHIIDLAFPITKVGSSEYLSSLEYQKELIDNFCGGINNA